jgi:hypothetical protein
MQMSKSAGHYDNKSLEKLLRPAVVVTFDYVRACLRTAQV